MISFHVLCKSFLSDMVYWKKSNLQNTKVYNTPVTVFVLFHLFIYFKDEWHVLDNEVSKLGLFCSAVQDDSLLNEYIGSNVCKISLYNSFSKRFFKGLIKVICFYSVRCLRPCYLLWTCEVVDIWWQIISKVFSQSLYCQHFRNKLMT